MKTTTSNGIELEVERNDLRLGAIMNFSVLKNLTQDNAKDVLAQLHIGTRKLTAELAKYSTAVELTKSIVDNIAKELEINQENLDQIQKVDYSTESDVIRESVRNIKTPNALQNIIDNVRVSLIMRRCLT